MFTVVNEPANGLFLIEPKVFKDQRGYFFETYNSLKFQKINLSASFVQDNESKSMYGTIRGLHYQKRPYSQAKLVRVISGRVLDVVVDMRADSSTYGKVFTFELSGENQLLLYVPKGFAHGYSTLSESAVFSYKCDEYYNPEYEDGIIYNDPKLAIDWKIPENKIILSGRDQKWSTMGTRKL